MNATAPNQPKFTLHRIFSPPLEMGRGQGFLPVTPAPLPQEELKMEYETMTTEDLILECRRRELIEEKKIIGGDEKMRDECG